VVSPLRLTHRAVEDGWIRSLAYDHANGHLEIDFRWNNGHQYWMVSLALFRELWKPRPMYLFLHGQIFPNSRIRAEYVRTEGKLLVSMLKGLVLQFRERTEQL
jgi:hypothetical protein